MKPTDMLLIALLVVGLGRIAQAHFHHKELMTLLNDLGTMTGEVFPFLRQLTGKDNEEL